MQNFQCAEQQNHNNIIKQKENNTADNCKTGRKELSNSNEATVSKTKQNRTEQ